MQNGSDISIDGDDHTTENIQTNGALSIPLAALGFMTRLASGIFSRGQRNTDDSSVNSGGDNEVLSERNNSSNASHETPTIDKGEEHGVVEESHLLNAPTEHFNINFGQLSDSPRSEVDNSRFKGFDIVKDPLDHYYLGANGQVRCKALRHIFCLEIGFSIYLIFFQ